MCWGRGSAGQGWESDEKIQSIERSELYDNGEMQFCYL